ncbi:MAG: amidohydrolase family protein, partial [Thermodesulfovibrionaceae bacterium]
VELAKIIATKKGIYATHIRSEGERLLSSLEETVLIGEKSKVSIHISHLKSSGKENWWKIDSALRIIEDAQKKGVRITADTYPYTASQTELDVFLPPWIIEGSKEEIIERIKKKNVRNSIKKYFKEKGEDFLKNLIISNVANRVDSQLIGKNLFELTKLNHIADFICDLLIRSELQVEVIYFGMSEENLEKILQKPYTMIGTDASAKCKEGITAKGKPHPRGFGSFPRFIKRYVLEKKLLPLEEAIKKITSLPAKTFKIEKRGVIKEGYFADMVIFDPTEIEDTATFADPFKISKGIKYVIVNGKITVVDGVLTGIRNGKTLV